jgi:hypothetical protein
MRFFLGGLRSVLVGRPFIFPFFFFPFFPFFFAAGVLGSGGGCCCFGGFAGCSCGGFAGLFAFDGFFVLFVVEGVEVGSFDVVAGGVGNEGLCSRAIDHAKPTGATAVFSPCAISR